VCGDGTGRRVFGNGARVEAADFAAWAWEKEGSCWVGEEGRLGAWTGQGFIDWRLSERFRQLPESAVDGRVWMSQWLFNSLTPRR
jgi:hypothetical protein